MPYRDYDRYVALKNSDGTINSMPFISLPANTSDKFEFWRTESSRLDKISQKYYGNPFYDFLILYANNSYVSEFDIPENAILRIPFHLDKARADYEAMINQFKE